MDADRFDALAKAMVARGGSRRWDLRVLGGGALGGLLRLAGPEAAAASHFCRAPGRKCTKGSQCCSGRCNKRKKKCGPCPRGTVFCAPQEECIPVNSYCCQHAECYRLVDAWGGRGSENGQFDDPYGIAADGAGHVYVTDYRNHRIQKFDGDGTFLTKWGGEGSGDGEFRNPWGVAADRDGNVYVADSNNHRIQTFAADGAFLAQWGGEGGGEGQFR